MFQRRPAWLAHGKPGRDKDGELGRGKKVSESQQRRLTLILSAKRCH